MAKSNYLSGILFIVAVFICYSTIGFSIAEQTQESRVSSQDYSDIIARVKQVYDSQIGVRESGLNRGTEVEKYLHYVNLPQGNPWCAAFVCWVFGKAGVSNPRTGWSPSLFPASNVIWNRESRTRSQEPGRPPSVLESDRGYPTRQTTGNNWLRAESGKLKVESPVEEQRAWSRESGTKNQEPRRPPNVLETDHCYPTRQTTGNSQADSYRLLTPSTSGNPVIASAARQSPSKLATGNRQPDSYRVITPSTGDVFGIYFPEKKRIAHVGFIDSWDGTWLISVEGNTNTSGNADGDGVYRKRRPTSSIYQVARYINY